MTQNKINIAIDGFSSCGKSTVAKQLAAELGYVYIDSGAMYRAVTLYAMENNLFIGTDLNEKSLISNLQNIQIELKYDQETGKQITFLNNNNVEDRIRKMDVSERVSPVATVKEVRAHLVYLQQQLALKKGIVMDGRDIGTVVLPQAELKIFMTASPDIRAKRRQQELINKGEEVDLETVKANLEKRDFIDQNRAESPLKKAHDARVLDNSAHTLESQLELVKSWVAEIA